MDRCGGKLLDPVLGEMDMEGYTFLLAMVLQVCMCAHVCLQFHSMLCISGQNNPSFNRRILSVLQEAGERRMDGLVASEAELHM